MYTKNQNAATIAAVATGVAFGTILCAALLSNQQSVLTEQSLHRVEDMVSSKPVPTQLYVPYAKGGFTFGRIPVCDKRNPMFCGMPIGADGNILILGGPGSGKTTCLVYPTINTWKQGSLIALDCKGGMEDLWHDVHPSDGKKLYVFAPYRKDGGVCSYDFFALLRLDPSHISEHAQDLSEGLIPIEPSDKETVWKKSAQNLCTAAILHYYNEGKSFAETIQEINCHSLTELIDLLCASKSKHAQAFVNKFKDASGKTKASIGIELNELPRLLLNREVMDALTPSPDRPVIDWNLLNISREPFDVIIEVPGNKLKQHSPLIRLLITQLVKTLSLRKEKTYSAYDLPSTLLMLDEFPQLGNMPAVVDGLVTLRSKGVTIALCAQSPALLESIYGESAMRTIFDTCRYKVILNATDPKSQDYLSRMIGTTDVRTLSLSQSVQTSTSLLGVPSFSNSLTATAARKTRPLIYPAHLAYLKRPIVLSPYGVFEIDKVQLYPNSLRKAQRELSRKDEELSRMATIIAIQKSKSTQELSNQANSSTYDESVCECDLVQSCLDESVANKEALMGDICVFCETPKSANEIIKYFKFTGKSVFHSEYLAPLVEQKRLSMTHPDCPTHPHQKYQSTTLLMRT